MSIRRIKPQLSEQTPQERPGLVVLDTVLLLLFSLALLLLYLFEGSPSALPIFSIHLCFNLALLLIALHLLFSKRLRRKPSQLDLLVLAVFMYACLSCATAIVKLPAMRQLPFFLDYAAAYLLGSTLLSHRFRGFALLAVLLTLIVLGGAALSSFAALTSGSPVILLFIFSVPLALYLFFSHYPRPSEGLLRFARMAFFCICIVIALWVANQMWKARTDAARYEREKQTHYASDVALHTFFEHPLLGVGIGNLQLLSHSQSAMPLKKWSIFKPGFLPLMAELGIFGSILWGLLILLFFAAVLRREASDASFEKRLRKMTIGASALGLLIAGYFAGIPQTASMNVLLLALIGMVMFKAEAPIPKESFRSTSGKEKSTAATRHELPAVRYSVAVVLIISLIIVSILEATPVFIASCTTLRKGENLLSESYARRLVLASKIAPYDPAPQLLLARHYRARLDKERDIGRLLPKIVDSYEEAISRNPYSPEGYFQLAEVYRRSEKLRDSLLVLETGLSYNPNSLELNLALLSGYEKQGWLGNAIKQAREISIRFPEFEGVNIRLAKIYARSGNSAASRRQLYYALQKNPLSPAVRAALSLSGE